jgi:hypothetical protein
MLYDRKSAMCRFGIAISGYYSQSIEDNKYNTFRKEFNACHKFKLAYLSILTQVNFG